MRHGRWQNAWLIPLLLLLLPAGSLAQNTDVVFHWAPSPLEGDEGEMYSPAVEYEVYHQRDGGLVHVAAVVTDTLVNLSLEPGVTHRIMVVGLDDQDRRGIFSEWSDDLYIDPDIPETGEPVPLAPGLQPNYPNPFNPETTITYGVPEAAGSSPRLALEIYDIQGRRVRRLLPEGSPGWHSVRWDGTDDSGRVQPTGTYIVRFSCNGRVETSKMTMVK